jgi:hypothetical protein
MRPEAEASGYLEATTKAKASAKEEADSCGNDRKKSKSKGKRQIAAERQTEERGESEMQIPAG